MIRLDFATISELLEQVSKLYFNQNTRGKAPLESRALPISKQKKSGCWHCWHLRASEDSWRSLGESCRSCPGLSGSRRCRARGLIRTGPSHCRWCLCLCSSIPRAVPDTSLKTPLKSWVTLWRCLLKEGCSKHFSMGERWPMVPCLLTELRWTNDFLTGGTNRNKQAGRAPLLFIGTLPKVQPEQCERKRNTR